MVTFVIVFAYLMTCFSQGHSNDFGVNNSDMTDMSCILPKFPENGHYLLLANNNSSPMAGQIVQNGSVLYFLCNQGFKPIISTSAICHQKKWLTEFKECQPTKVCILPTMPENGGYYALINGTDVSSKVKPGHVIPEWTPLIFTCNILYDLIGDNVTLCREGHWSAAPPRCQKSKRCILPKLPKNGNYVIVGPKSTPVVGHDTSELTALNFWCQADYALTEGPVTVCTEGTWLGGVPECNEIKYCILPGFPKNGNYTVIGSNIAVKPGFRVKEKETLKFTCLPDFKLMGQECITCYDRNWTTGVPRCIEKRSCFIPSPPENGSFSLVGFANPPVPGFVVDEKETLEFSCRPGFQLSGKESATCYSGKWTYKTPICKDSRTCMLPSVPSNGQYNIVGSTEVVSPGQSVSESTVLKFSCNSSYNLEGAAVIYCQNKNWSSAIPKCLKYDSCSNIIGNRSGEYIIHPLWSASPFSVYCDLTLAGGNWTVIQSRQNGFVDFFRNYQNYTDGFGNAAGEFWLGLDRIYQLTEGNKNELYVDLEAFDGTKKFARYSVFNVASNETGYKLTVNGYSGNAGESFYYNSGAKFSTFDKDQDETYENCAQKYTSAWWHKSCSNVNLNGVYYDSAVQKDNAVYWVGMFNNKMSLKTTRIMMRNV